MTTLTPDIIEIEVPAPSQIVEVEIPGLVGPRGPRGPNITASGTPPSNPQFGDLWIDISQG